MKIGIEVQRLFRMKKYGIETSSLELIKKFQELDQDNEYVLFVKDDLDRGCFTESANFKIRKVGGRFFADFEQFFLPIAARNEKVDLLHCTGNTTPYLSSVPIVQTLHDIIFMDPIPRNDTLYQRLGNQYRRRLVPLVSPRSKALITVSHYEKERIVSRLSVDEKRIHVIYNGINEKHFKVHDNADKFLQVQQYYNIPESFILFLGNPSVRKNPLGVIEAYVMYASKVSHPLPLVTPGLPVKYIQHALHKLNVAYDPNRFISPGYIREEDLPYLYALSKTFLFPSLSEGFGMPIVEAMACGTPVITSKISCMPEIAGDAAMLVDPMSPPSIAEGLIHLLEDPVLRCEKIQDGLVNARRFSWTKTAEQVLGVYHQVLHPQPKTNSSGRISMRRILEPSFYFSNKSRA
jgi:glycosyltransferase involved in cell wall biosynthesis